jgi:aminoglycoside phosphotransferase (APT) family kinase protein
VWCWLTDGPWWSRPGRGRRRERLAEYPARLQVGHGDFESQNIAWHEGRPLAVHDWDSVIAQPEAAVAGLAAAVWPARGDPGQAATVGQTADFLAAYQAASRAHWDRRDLHCAWAAGLWVRLFNAKKDAASGGGPQLDLLAAEVSERLARAGIDRLQR